MKQISCKLFSDCAIFKLNMHYSLDSFSDFVKFAKKTLDSHDLKNAIVDLRFVPEKIPTMDRFELGVMMAEKFPLKYRIAVLANLSNITKFAENVAVNRGAGMLVSHDMKEIRRWLKAKE